jgi:uncharacterized membrane protein
MSTYFLGVLSALLAGICYNIGYLLQKIGIERVEKKTFKFTKLLTKPVWLTGVFLQIILGIPFYALAQFFIGPSLVPGLMAVGIIFLVTGSNWLMKEKLTVSEKIGLGLIIVSIFFIGFSQLNIDLSRFDLLLSDFLYRLLYFNICYLLLLILLLVLPRFLPHLKGIFNILASGLFFALANLWLGIVVGFWGRYGLEIFAPANLYFFVLTAGLTLVTGFLAIYLTQKALQSGKVSVLIPTQNIPIQITPVILYFFVFKLTAETWQSVLFISTGIALILIGSYLLVRRQENL